MPISAALAVFVLALTPVEVLERVVAVVNGRPLLLSETRALARVRGVDPDQALELLMDETLMYEQASRSPQAAVSADEEQAALVDLLRERSDLRENLNAQDLRRLLRRQSAILKYVEFRFRPQARPSDEEVATAYAEEHEGRPEAPAFETVAEALRERLTRQRLDVLVEEWVRGLRQDADLRHVSPPSEEAARE
jgi:hypothetical protein